MTPKQLINHANSLTSSFQETEREMQKSYRLKREQAINLGDTTEANRLFDAADAEEAQLKKCRDAFLKCNAEIDALLVSPAMAKVTNTVVDEKAAEARGHMQTIKDIADKVAALAAFTGFLVQVAGLIATFR